MVLAGLVVGAVNAAEYAPTQAPATHDVRWTPADADRPVDVDAQSRVIELSPVVITARLPRAPRRQVGDCAFDFRPVAQGPVNGMVRGFCTEGAR